MTVPYEIEMKLAVEDKAEFARLKASLDEMAKAVFQDNIVMKAIYFDTVGSDLAKQRMAYRIRQENDVLVATLKGGGSAENGLHKRLECNVAVQSEKPDLSVFAAGEGALLLGQLTAVQQDFIELVRTEFDRTVYLWQSGGAVVEIALDEGWIYGGTARTAILELELELKSGAETALSKLADYFQTNFRLSPADKSKFLRGLELCKVVNKG